MTPSDSRARPAPEAAPPVLGRRLILALAAAAVVLSGIVGAGLLMHLRSVDLEAGELLIRSFAQLAGEQTMRTMQATERTLRQVEAGLNALEAGLPGDEAAFNESLSVARLDGREFLGGVWVLDVNGTVAYGARRNIGLQLSDREYFRSTMADPRRDVRFGVPIQGRSTGAWLIPVTIPWRRPDGTLAGVIVVALDSQYFDRVWTLEPSSAERSIALFRSDAVLLMRSPFIASSMGLSFGDLPVFREHIALNRIGSVRTVSVLDGQSRLIAYRAITGFPDLVVLVSETVERVLATWTRTAWILACGWLAAAAAIMGLAAWLAREWSRRVHAAAALRAEVAERARAEEQANAARSRLLDAIRAFPGSFRLFDRDERLVVTNEGRWIDVGAGIPGVNPGDTITDMVGRSAAMELDTAAIGRGEEWMRERLAQFRRSDTDAEISWRDGRWFHLLERRTSDGGTISLRLDITARKRIEEQLRQAQKMEAVGQLTGGIAHDFNNMLTIIIGNAELLLDQVAADPRVRSAGEQILRAAEGSADLTGRLLAFARRTPLQPRRVEVNEFVARIDGLLRRTLGEDIDVGLALADDVWDLTIDPGQLQAAIVNLAVNARDAMPSGGKLTIETANAEIDADYAAVNQDARVGQFVVVAISDTGEGMSAETMRRAFEPFFSTKEVGKGTGLGLSMVYGFVRQSEGHVKIYSELGRGTTVRMYLPRATDGLPIDESPAEETLPMAQGETVLVVEDDDDVRSHVASQLKGLGYRVIDAGDGPDALAILSGATTVDLLLTDVVMPGGMTGRDVADAVGRLRPGTKVLFMSGYTQTAIVHGGRLDVDARLLSKPFRLRDLARKVRETLDG